MIGETPNNWLVEWIRRFAIRPLVVSLNKRFGVRPNDRSAAERYCSKKIIPAFDGGRVVVLDFAETAIVTQAFIHALLDEAITRDPRWAFQLKVANISKAQHAIVRLAMRHMLASSRSNVRQSEIDIPVLLHTE